MYSINKLERVLLKIIAKDNSIKYPYLKSHILILTLKERKLSGVGSFTTFTYTEEFDVPEVDDMITSNKALHIEPFKYEIAYVLFIKRGKVSALEIVLNEDGFWDGSYEKFTLN